MKTSKENLKSFLKELSCILQKYDVKIVADNEVPNCFYVIANAQENDAQGSAIWAAKITKDYIGD